MLSQEAVEAYLTALFIYFKRLFELPPCTELVNLADDGQIMFSLRTLEYKILYVRTLRNLSVLEVIDSSNSAPLSTPSFHSANNDASAICANNTASQEKMILGASPELCVSALFMRDLQNDQLLMVETD